MLEQKKTNEAKKSSIHINSAPRLSFARASPLGRNIPGEYVSFFPKFRRWQEPGNGHITIPRLTVERRHYGANGSAGKPGLSSISTSASRRIAGMSANRYAGP